MSVDFGNDQTIDFLPDRLNRDPVVLRGMTSNEMFIIASLGSIAGGAIGFFAGLLFRDIAIGVSIMVVITVIVFFVSSGILQRSKRGKPDTWFHRSLQWEVASKTGLNVGHPINLRSGVWSTKRSKEIVPNNKERDEE